MIYLNSPQVFRKVLIASPFVFGLISVFLGADTNWDLRNYHFYNPFAFLNNKLSVDFAVAAMQTYFNPLIDLPYYFMVIFFPAPIVGFFMGFIHGINFILVACISRQVLGALPNEDEYKIPLILTFFACTTVNFSTTLGNTMGDSVISLFMLSSVLILLRNKMTSPENCICQSKNICFAGFLAGLGGGLKLTGLVYPLALCMTVFVCSYSWKLKIKHSVAFGVFVLIGMAITSGYWFYTLWDMFRNPFFPQFSNIFPNPLVLKVGMAGSLWNPTSWKETLLWPFIFSIDPLRVGQNKSKQIIWAIAYAAFIFLVITALIGKIKNPAKKILGRRSLFIIVYVGLGFFIWMEVFSYQRYLVSIELLSPLFIYIAITSVIKYDIAKKIVLSLLVLNVVIIVIAGPKTWDHAPWSYKMFDVDVPELKNPDNTTVIIVAGLMPYGWVVPYFPKNVAFTQLGSYFPGEFSAYKQRVHAMIDPRRGEVYVLFPDGLMSLEDRMVTNTTDPLMTYFPIVKKILIEYGFKFNGLSCKTYSAYIGKQPYHYRWCGIEKL